MTFSDSPGWSLSLQFYLGFYWNMKTFKKIFFFSESALLSFKACFLLIQTCIYISIYISVLFFENTIFFIFFSIMVYHRIWYILPYAIH